MITPDFSRTELLLGKAAMQQLAQKRVILFGVGGVGSWCAESLIRSGITHLTIVDNDNVCESNLNRQLMATTQTIGSPKVNILRDRLLSINPQAEIETRQEIYSAETAAGFHLEQYDYVIDAIDSLQHKAHLILQATSLPVKFYSSMGAARKMDPARIQKTEFWKVKGCPLAASLRRYFKRHKQFPAHKFQCVFSDELLANKGSGENQENHSTRTNGTVVHITAIFGFTLASLVVSDAISGL